MKPICSLLLSLMVISTPIVGSESISYTSEVISQNLKDHLYETQDKLRFLCDSNPDVLKRNKVFLIELEKAYSSGTGLIEKDVHRILDAILFSATKHQMQTRKDYAQTPYIIHPIGVAHYLLLIGNVRDSDILIGALLHDTVEDTATSFEEIRNAFGKRVENFVREVTDDKSLPKEERKRLQIVHAKEKSAGAAQIKLGDKLYNLNDLSISPPPDWTKERIKAYFEWATLVVNNLPWVNAPLKQAVDEVIANKLKM